MFCELAIKHSGLAKYRFTISSPGYSECTCMSPLYQIMVHFRDETIISNAQCGTINTPGHTAHRPCAANNRRKFAVLQRAYGYFSIEGKNRV